MRVTLHLSNEYHGTSVTVRPVYSELRNSLTLSPRAYRRMRHALCPHEDCKCSQSAASGDGQYVANWFSGWGTDPAVAPAREVFRALHISR